MGDSSGFSTRSGESTFSGTGSQPVVVGLGANQGERQATLLRAVAEIERIWGTVSVSPLYESAPVGGPAQGPYLNAAVLLWTAEPLGEVLDRLQQIELDHGRVRTERWGPRTLDLDILWAEARTIRTSSLIVPHPELERRAFALRPLLDLVPTAKSPTTGSAYDQILGQLEDQELCRIHDEKWWKRSPP